MQRTLIIISAILFIIIGGLTIFSVALFKTNAGQRLLVSQIESRLGDAINGEARVGSLSGTLPGHIIVRDFTVSDEAGTWLAIEKTEMTWTPFALINQSIKIETIAVDGLTFTRPPEQQQTAEPESPVGFEFPNSLPKITVGTFSLTDAKIRNPVSGEMVPLEGTASLSTGGKKVQTTLDIKSANTTDSLQVVVDFDPAQPNATVNIALNSNADGILTAMGEFGAPVSIELKGDAPPENFAFTLHGVFGLFGEAVSTFTFDLDDRPTMLVQGSARLGEKLRNLSDQVGSEIHVDTTLRDTADGTRMTLNNLSAQAITANGQATWRNENKKLQRLESAFQVDVNPGFFADLQAQLGSHFESALTLTLKKNTYNLFSTLKGNDFSIAVEDAQTDLIKEFIGTIAFDVAKELPAITSFERNLRLQTQAIIKRDEDAKLNNLILDAGETRVLTGNGSYNFNNDQITANSLVTVTPSLTRSLAPQLSLSETLEAEFNVEGRLDDFTANLMADIPRVSVNDAPVPASNLVAHLSGLPSRPSGEITAQALDDTSALAFSVRSSRNGDIAIKDLNHRGDKFDLHGEGLLNPKAKRMLLDLRYQGKPSAMPFPGVPIVGDFKANGSVNIAKGSESDLTITSTQLTVDDFALQNFIAAIKGPSDALAVTIDASNILATGSNLLSDVSTQAVVQLDATPFGAISGLSFNYGDIPFRLTQTATVKLDDIITLDNFRAAIGEEGQLAIDGAYASNQLKAKINAKSLPFPQAAAFIDFKANIDTDNDLHATGSAALRADSAENETDNLAIGFTWRENRLTITDSDNNDPLKVNVNAPLILTRTPVIGISLTGDIAGDIAYDGPVETISALLPATLQSLEGILKTDITLAGDVETPQISGDLLFSDGAYTELSSGLSLVNLSATAQARTNQNGADITFSGGASGPGQQTQTITLTGGLKLNDNSRLDSTVKMRDARFSAGPVSSITANGDITLTGPLNALESNGVITIEELNAEIITPESTGLVDIDIIAINEQDAQLTPLEPTPQQSTLTATIAIKADDKIFIRGRGLESEWAADVTTEINDNPIVLGRVDLRRGWLDFSGRRFDLTKGEITFNRLSPNDPYLDMRAEYETSDGTIAAIVVKGRSQSPAIELESAPSLPREDIMALVLFGKPASELTATESLQMAQALAQLGGIGPFGGSGLTGSARQTLGLDLLNIDLDPENGGSALTVGKYVADGLFVSATQDVRGENGSVRVEYEITNNITVETELQQSGDQTVSANWKRDF